jgi:hypothetical protein
MKLIDLPGEPGTLATFPKPIQDLLLEAGVQQWAAGVDVETSLNGCRLSVHGVVELSLRLVVFDRVEASLNGHSSQKWTRILAVESKDAIAGLEAGLAQGIEEAGLNDKGLGLPGLVHCSRPARQFRVGDWVRVKGPKQKRIAEGQVRETGWHHRHGRWMYLLELDGKPIALRFWDDELETQEKPL